MKTQLFIFFGLLAIAFSHSHNALPNMSPQQIKSFVNAQRGCILHDQPCNSEGKIIKSHLPIMLKGCNVNGCGKEASPKVSHLVEMLKKIAPQDLYAVLQKYGH